MTGVVTDACIKCKYMDCVEVCPVDAFYEGENMLVINPGECVDCGCCIEECPIDAIVFDTEERAQPWVRLNAEYANLWPNVTFKDGQTPPDADRYRAVSGKFERDFSPSPGKGDVGVRVDHVRVKSCHRCADASILEKLLRMIRSLWQ